MERNAPVVSVFGASTSRPGDAEYRAGVRCGGLLGTAGLAVATGGYGGLMEAVSAGASEVGGHVIGVTAPTVFTGRAGPNGHVAEEVPADSLTQRIHELVHMADACIALPGSLGTLTELTVAWNSAFAARFSGAEPLPVVAVGPRWRNVIDHLAGELETDKSVIRCVDNVDEAAAWVIARLAR